jgi:hypothetical protein
MLIMSWWCIGMIVGFATFETRLDVQELNKEGEI